MKKKGWKILQEQISDTSEALKGKDIYYKCMKCNELIPSQPNDNVGCKCGNIFIDVDTFRLIVQDYHEFQVVQ